MVRVGAELKSLYARLAELLEEDGSVAVATVIATRGSTPREAGAKMLVRRSGQTWGTVGGGCGEATVRSAALRVLDGGGSLLVEVDLTGDVAEDSGDVCGGIMEVLVEAWTSRSGAKAVSDLHIASRLAELLGRREPAVLATVVSAGQGFAELAGTRALIGANGIVMGGLGSPEPDGWLHDQASRVMETGGVLCLEFDVSESRAGRRGTSPRPEPLADWAQIANPPLSTQQSLLGTGSARLFMEAVLPPPRLLVLGAGHISVPLARMGKMMGFAVTVLDDRPAFANSERFPEAETVLAEGFPAGICRLGIDRASYVVLVTRGHRHDVECLRDLATCDLAYLGMIGSRRRVRAVFDMLRKEGVPQDRLDRVHAPIGLDIGARTPEEIALSIMAEVVKVRRRGSADSLRNSWVKANEGTK